VSALPGEDDGGGCGGTEGDASHRGRSDAAHHTVKPVVVGLRGRQLPLVHGAAAALGTHTVFDSEVVCEETMLDGLAPEDGEATGVAHRSR